MHNIQKDIEKISLIDIIPNINNYFKHNHYHHILLILTYKISEYYHNDKNKEINKYDFISFISKILQYDNTLKNRNLFYDNKGNSLISLDKWIYQHQLMTFIKIEENIGSIQIRKTYSIRRTFSSC